MSSPLCGRTRRARLLPLLVSTALMGVPMSAAHADGPLATAQQRAELLRQRLDALQAQAAIAVGEFETVHEDLEQAVTDSLSAQSRLDDARASNDAAHGNADDRVRAIYKSGGRAALYISVLQTTDADAVLARAATLSAIVNIDTASAEQSAVSEGRAKLAVARYDATIVTRQRLETLADEQTLEVERLMAAQEQMIAGADAEVQQLIEAQRRREEAARQVAIEAETRRLATLSQVVSTGDLSTVYQPAAGRYSCPAGTGVTFADTWHAPRSGGRLHQGTDVFATHGSPAYAVTDGVVDKWGNGGLGGITLWIRARNGDRYYYAHNSQNLAAVGTAVHAGDVVALVGQTGNAAGTPPHIHFEAHAGGGAAANPYPFLAAICGRR